MYAGITVTILNLRPTNARWARKTRGKFDGTLLTAAAQLGFNQNVYGSTTMDGMLCPGGRSGVAPTVQLCRHQRRQNPATWALATSILAELALEFRAPKCRRKPRQTTLQTSWMLAVILG